MSTSQNNDPLESLKLKNAELESANRDLRKYKTNLESENEHLRKCMFYMFGVLVITIFSVVSYKLHLFHFNQPSLSVYSGL